MNLSRREFAFLTSSLAAGALLGPRLAGATPSVRSLRSAGTYFEWKPVGANAWAGIGEGGNTLVVASKGELVLVDTKFAAFAAGLRREAEGLVSESKHALKLVINTHHHGDHSGGNLAFSVDTPILAQEKAKPRIEAQLDRYKQQVKSGATQLARSEKPEAKSLFDDATKLAEKLEELKASQFTPSQTFGAEHETKIGDVAVQLRHYGTGHTDNDAIVYLPSLNVMHAGDLLFNKIHPVMDVSAGSNSAGWIESVKKAAALCNDKTVVVPGHGAITDKAGLLGQITYFETVRKAVKEAVDAGKAKEEVIKLKIEALKDYDNNRLTTVLGVIFEEIKAAK